MASQSYTEGNFHVGGTLSCNSISVPAASFGDTEIKGAANIDAAKLIHQHIKQYAQADGTAVVAQTQGIHIAKAAGTVVQFEAIITGLIATGGDRTVTVDLQKGNAGSGYASVLTAPISFSSSDALRTVKGASISVSAYSDNDSFRIVVTVAGAAGNQAQGVLATATLRENP